MLTPLEGRVRVERDVIVGRGGTRDLRCDVYHPPVEASERPAALVIHGGGWQEGDRTQLQGYATQLARRGLVAVACEYRLSGEAHWPAQKDDVATSLQWLRDTSGDLNVDRRRIALLGASAGAHLALMLAAEQDLAAVVALYPPARLAPRAEDNAGSLLLGPGANAEAFRQASPLTQLRPGFPPTLLLHGDADDLVPAQDSIDLYQRLRELGSAAELHIFSGAPHAFDVEPDYGRQCLQLITLFLEKRLGRPAG